MKRLLVVLFGVLVFQGSVWAESCLKAYPDDGSLVTAEILHPASSGLVLKKKAPFLLQWKVVEVSQTVNIRLYKKGAEGKDLFGKRLNNRPNTGTVLITKQDFKKAKVKAGEEYFFQVELNPTRSEQVISSECFTFNVKQKEDLQCNNATTVKDCLQALIEQNRQTAVEMRELTERLEALEGGDGTTGGGGNNAEQQSSEVGGHDSIDGTFAEGTPWREVVDAGQQENPDLNACHCDSDYNYDRVNLTRPAYCPPTLIGYAVGENSYDSNDPDLQNTVRTLATDRVAGRRTYFDLSAVRMRCK